MCNITTNICNTLISKAPIIIVIFLSMDLKGFKVVRLKYKIIGPERHLFIKEHSSRKHDPDKPVGRTLYILNIPPWLATEELLKKAFRVVGKVLSVALQPSLPGCGFKNGHIVFSTTEALEKSLELTLLGPIDTPNDPIITGVQKWIREYNENVLSIATIPAKIDEVQRRYALDQKALKRSEKQAEKEEDEDGWTVVSKKGRNPGLARKESVGNRLQEKIEKKKKVLQNFYRHQIRESKQNKLIELREKFEKEKLRAAKMRESRKFKPY